MTSPAEKVGDPVVDVVRRSRLRVVFSKLVRGTADGIVAGLLVFLAFGTYAETAGVGRTGWTVFWVVLLLGFIAYLIREVTTGTSLRSVAIVLDQRMGYHDRVSSALVFAGFDQQSPFMQAHLVETAEFLSQRTQEKLPLPRINRFRMMVLFLALVLVSLVPHSDRSALKHIDRRHRQETRVKAARSLVKELKNLRREADLRGLKKLTEMVATVEKDLERQLKLVTPQDLTPPETPEDAGQSDTPGKTAHQDSDDKAVKPEGAAAIGGEANVGLRLSSVATYQPVGKFDSFPEAAYGEVFAELDASLLDGEISAKELSQLAEHLDDVAGKLGNYAQYTDTENVSVDNATANKNDGMEVDTGKYNAVEKALAPTQYRSFSEFLKRYAAHVGDKGLGQAKFEMSQEENTGGQMFNVSAPPPKDAKFAIKGVTEQQGSNPILQTSADQAAQIASKIAAQDANMGRGTQLGGKGAGVGGAGRRGSAPAVLPRDEGGEYLPLKGKLNDGASIIQVINEQGRRKIVAGKPGEVSYRDVFVHYAHGAEAELNGEQVPVHMRDYIRDYFRSIRPGADQSKID